jgi:DNA-binding transcriptional MerR regulator
MAAVQRVRMVKWFQALGFSLQDIREILPDQIDASTKAAIRAKARGKILELKKQISALQSITRTLEEVSLCDCTDECPIVAAAMSGTSNRASRTPSRVTHSRRIKR